MANTFRIAKVNKNALTATDPRDFIFHANYNTFKIVNELTHSPNLSNTGLSETGTNKAHGMSYTPFTFAFCRFANNRVGPPGSQASNADFWFSNLQVNSSNVIFRYMNNTGGSYTPSFRALQTELPLAGTPSFTHEKKNALVIAKNGFNARTETNPNNLIFDSRYKSLKYFIEGQKTISVPSKSYPAITEVTLETHNLNYYPFFTASGQINTSPVYIMPIVFADIVENYDFIYATKTSLIYRSYRNSPFGGSSAAYTFKIYYKIFSYDLGL